MHQMWVWWMPGGQKILFEDQEPSIYPGRVADEFFGSVIFKSHLTAMEYLSGKWYRRESLS